MGLMVRNHLTYVELMLDGDEDEFTIAQGG
jgi:hypothetical protein